MLEQFWQALLASSLTTPIIIGSGLVGGAFAAVWRLRMAARKREDIRKEGVPHALRLEERRRKLDLYPVKVLEQYGILMRDAYAGWAHEVGQRLTSRRTVHIPAPIRTDSREVPHTVREAMAEQDERRRQRGPAARPGLDSVSPTSFFHWSEDTVRRKAAAAARKRGA